MHKLINTLNKFNGNICFIGETDFTHFIFECDYQGKTVSYAAVDPAWLVTDLCVESEDSYLVSFTNGWLGQYSALSGLILTYINTGIGRIDKVVGSASSGYYLLNQNLNRLYKFKWGYIWWDIALPDYSLRHDGKIVFRESDGNIIYCNNVNIYPIRDDGASAVVLNSLAIEGDGELTVSIGNEFKATYAYMRARTVSGRELDQSSSSSSVSSNSSSSSSSMSSGSSVSSDSSSSQSSYSSYSSRSSDSSSSKSSVSSSSSLSRSFSSESSSSTWLRTTSSSSSSSAYDCNIALTSIIPNMTSDTLPSPYVIYSTFEDGQGVIEPCTPKKWKAFNNTYDAGLYTFGYDAFSNPVPFTYLGVDLGLGHSAIIRHYKIVVDEGSCTVVSPPCPLEWYLQGSNVASPVMTTDTNWVNVHHVSVDITFWKPHRGSTYPLTRSAACFYNIGNITAYRYYRIRSVRNEGLLAEPEDVANSHVYIAQLDLAEHL